MRIVHTESSLGWGGQEIRILEESRGMIERGHTVQVLCPPESRIFAEGPKRGVPTIALPIGRRNVKGVLAMRKWLKNNPVDVINSHSSTDTWLAALACQTIMNAPAIVRTRHISVPIADNAASRWLFKKAVRHIVTTGEALRHQVVDRIGADPARVTSVPTGIDPERFRPGDKREARNKLGLDPDDHYIGIVATLRSWKGHLYLLDAFARLDMPGWKLLIVGDGPMRENIDAKLAELGLADRVILTGQQANPEDWLQAMDIFCLPSYANEGVPQAVVQAMMTGLAIISTRVGAISEALEDGITGLLVEEKNSEKLATALRSLCANPDQRLKLGAQAVRGANKFAYSAMLDRMETLFTQAMKPV